MSINGSNLPKLTVPPKHTKTMFLFSVFMVVALLAAVAVFAYRTYGDAFIERYLASITICGNIADEQDCFARSYCQGVYRPAEANSAELTFVGCRPLTKEASGVLGSNEAVCRQTGGSWYRNKLGASCLCDTGKQFNSNSGCQTL